MCLAGHLCQARCDAVLRGDVAWVRDQLADSFRRVQVNATSVNGVTISAAEAATAIASTASSVGEGANAPPSLLSSILAVPEIEWIIQRNEETEPIVLALLALRPAPPSNMSILFDASCGFGVVASAYAKPVENVPCGYAGGLGPQTLREAFLAIGAEGAARGFTVWVDMESSLRSKVDGSDSFDISKAWTCLQLSALAVETSEIELAVKT